LVTFSVMYELVVLVEKEWRRTEGLVLVVLVLAAG
jgi:hypothetical protein